MTNNIDSQKSLAMPLTLDFEKVLEMLGSLRSVPSDALQQLNEVMRESFPTLPDFDEEID